MNRCIFPSMLGGIVAAALIVTCLLTLWRPAFESWSEKLRSVEITTRMTEADLSKLRNEQQTMILRHAPLELQREYDALVNNYRKLMASRIRLIREVPILADRLSHTSRAAMARMVICS